MASQDKNDFISSCIKDCMHNGKTQEQASAICYSKWNEAKKSEINDNILNIQKDLHDAELIQKAEGSKYVNPDGTFKGGFDGCVSHFMETKGLKKENAEKLCAYIGRQAGKI